ncbi:uncharacterized protein LY89DRAFT_71983 [Mollisia scopiformis]|uniref:Uncharacterized protein n=1 Tax=Mollisia scopiformis TaxID=149040 RepID=A0A194XAA5_MOLSC|nr:uncharacterized protein LY89DRAFT_71983 [Mollisia scopiformis]KUJ17096.1 hypothetical protein LY89DRAFT_71983 [Mollisia scopiformis]
MRWRLLSGAGSTGPGRRPSSWLSSLLFQITVLAFFCTFYFFCCLAESILRHYNLRVFFDIQNLRQMAELGLIASGMGIASLGIQIGSGIIKLKQLWDDVNDAPEDIKYLLEEIETLSDLLSSTDENDNLPRSAK